MLLQNRKSICQITMLREYHLMIFSCREDSEVLSAGESNVYNDRTDSGIYRSENTALFEAERIKTELFNFEHDLWEY